MAMQHKDLAERLEELRKELHERIGEHDTQLAAIYDAIENLLDDKTEKKNWAERERIVNDKPDFLFIKKIADPKELC
jgi:hypothetical protein